MNLLLTLAFLFFIGSTLGYALEVLFRRFISSENPERKWINPGFCRGPYLPLYGCGLCLLYLISSLEKFNFISNPVWNKTVLFIIIAVAMTVIEYIAGIYCLKVSHVRLWDYSNEWGNVQGVICPKFSLIWAVLGVVYYLFIHPRILKALDWLSQNLVFSFFIGLFFGVFIIDMVNSTQLVNKLKKFAVTNNVIVRYETLKLHIRNIQDKRAERYRFFSPFHSERPLLEHLKDMKMSFETDKAKPLSKDKLHKSK